VDGEVVCSEADTTEFAFTPTLTSAGYTNAYEYPVDDALWYSYLPATVTSCALQSVAPARALDSVEALTDTSVEYEGSAPQSAGGGAGSGPNDHSPPKKTDDPRPPSTPIAQPVQKPSNPTKPTAVVNPIAGLAQIIQSARANNPPAAKPPTNPPPQPPLPAASPQSKPNAQGGSPAPAPAGQPAPPPGITITSHPIGPGSPAKNDNAATPAPQPTITVDSQPIAIPINPANPSSPIVIGSQTLIPGGPAGIISGTPVSIAPSATAIIVGGSTIPVPVPVAGGPTPTGAAITVDGQTITANPAGAFVINGQTLVPGGPAITVAGTPVSLGPQGTDVVVGTSTEGLGGLILNSLGASGSPTNTGTAQGSAYTGQVFTGETPSRRSNSVLLLVLVSGFRVFICFM
jgi:hypothetical protein